MNSQVPEAESNQEVIQQTLARIAGHAGVLGYLVLHPSDGRVLDFVGFRDDRSLANKYATNLYAFTMLAQSTVRTIDHNEDLTFVRMRWGRREVFIAPDQKREFVLIVVQEQVSDARLSVLAPDEAI